MLLAQMKIKEIINNDSVKKVESFAHLSISESVQSVIQLSL